MKLCGRCYKKTYVADAAAVMRSNYSLQDHFTFKHAYVNM